MAKDKTTKVVYDHGPMGYIMFMAWIGAVIYFVQQSEGFFGFVVAILQACVWPAYVLYEVLKILNV